MRQVTANIVSGIIGAWAGYLIGYATYYILEYYFPTSSGVPCIDCSSLFLKFLVSPLFGVIVGGATTYIVSRLFFQEEVTISGIKRCSILGILSSPFLFVFYILFSNLIIGVTLTGMALGVMTGIFMNKE